MRVIFKLIAFALLCSAFIPFNVNAENVGVGSISASSACLIDAEGGRVLYSKNAEKQLPMASTTKIMTAILALESGIPLDRVIKIPQNAVGVEGSSIYLRAGEEISFETLLYGLLLSSANDSAVAIAITVSGSVENFVALMNKKAQDLGLVNTHFTNPHGLYDKEHFTTALDLARIMAYCIKNEIFVSISGCYKKIAQAGEDLTRVMINHNRLLRTYDGVIAGKTGFTKMSGRCLVTVAEREGLRLIAVTLNAPNDWQDHTNLYDFGFANYRRVKIDGFTVKIPVISGNASEIEVKSSDFSLFLPKNSEEITTEIKAPRFIFATIGKGEKVGEVVYKCNGRILAKAPLLACETVEKVKYRFNIFTRIIDFIKGIFK
ncbi:MAG: D-alanyl-D-alanine carboxypeptidase [Clostridia bacterium]|nr:D-alanyl-D-alanine carboxypeptidase [Clostridia bacterium]